MKYSCTMIMTGAALLCFFVPGFVASAQHEKVIFSLTEGKFDNQKIPYVHPVVITGVPIKDKEAVDAITLVVKRVVSEDEQSLMAKRYQLGQLDTQLEAATKSLNFLKNEIDNKVTTDNVADIATKLKENGHTGLAEKFSAIAGQGSNPTAEQVNELSKDVTDDIARLQKAYDEQNNARIKLQAEVIKLEEVVSAGLFFEGTWLRKSEGDDEFTFAMPDKFKMAEKYIFDFTIYKKNKVTVPIDELLNPLVGEFDKTLAAHGYYSSEAVGARVTKAIKEIEDKFFTNVYNINPDVKKITPKKGFGLPAEVITNLSTLIEDFYQQQSDEKTDSELAARNKILMINAVNDRNITTRDHDEILRLIDLPGKAADLTSALTGAGYTAAERSTIISLYDTYWKKKEAAADQVAAAKKSREEIQKIFDNIKFLYTAAGTVQSTVSTGSTDIDGIMISTTYGIGMVSLDKNTVEWFRFLGVNLRFDGFDNRLPGKEAYHSYWSRISVMIGISTTADMQYKGDKLENTRLGIKPVIGINWEPAKHMNFGIGAISFIQESASESRKDPKLRPYVSLSFDFNLFNYLIQNQ